jgi:diamine N-acetyltransferase
LNCKKNILLGKEDISLRAPEPEDIDFLFGIENDTALWQLSNTLTPFSRFDIEQFIMSSEKDIFIIRQARFIIQKLDEGHLIPVGAVDLFDFDPVNRRAGVGIVVLEEYRHKGIATKSLDILIDYAFNHLNLHQLYCNIEEKNSISLGLFRNKGFKDCGFKLEWNQSGKDWTNEVMLQLINTN